MEEDAAEEEIKKHLAENKNMMSAVPKSDDLKELDQLWPEMDDEEKKDMIFTLCSKIVLHTDETNVKGVKNKFFDAYIGEVLYN
ncbi:hypothetical protein D3C74_343570 [compost metagenome]